MIVNNALINILPEVVNQIEQKGFSVFSAWDTEADTVQNIARQFGKIMGHIRANEAGLKTNLGIKTLVKICPLKKKNIKVMMLVK